MVVVNKNHGRIIQVTATPGYNSWARMMDRCYNPRSKDYEDYGGRGISVCSSWHKSRNFLNDMGPKPEGMELERIDNSKGYNKNNCRWATRTDQNRNKRNTKLSKEIVEKLRVEYDGTAKFFTLKAREFGCSATAIRSAVRGRNYKL